MSWDKCYIISIQRCLGSRKAMQRLTKANLYKNIGMEGDHHARVRSQRQLLIIEEEVLQALNLSIGEVRENITTRGVSLGKIAEVRGYK